MSNEAKLPEKLSDCIILALADLEKVEASDQYVVNMHEWHRPGDDNRCVVCLAGAVIAETLGGVRLQVLSPSHYPDETATRLFALNDVRCGDVCGALLHQMGVHESIVSDFVTFYPDVPDYEESPKEFKSKMREIAQMLKEHDL